MRCELEGSDPPELVVTDSLGNVLRVGAPGWLEGTAEEVDDEWGGLARVGRADGLHLPPVAVMVSTDGTIRDTVTVGVDSYTVEAPVTLRVDAAVRARIRIPDGEVRIEPTEHRDAFRVRLSEESVRMRFAFQSRVPTETEEVVVSADPSGVARALSTAHRTITDRSPDRTWPSQRPRTATVTLGEEPSVPSSLAVPDDPEVVVSAPVEPATLLPLAPVAAYFGAAVTTGDDAVVIETDERVWRIAPPDDRTGEDSQRAYERDVHGHLERAFWLDCLAREAGDVADGHRRSGFLDTHGLSAERLYDAPIPERLVAYDDVPVADVRSTFPDWHYGVSVRPEVESVESLGHRLHRLPLVHVADGTELPEVEVVARSIEASRGPESPGPQMVEPNPTPARTHAWAGDGVPLAGWKLLDGEGTRDPARSSDESLAVVVVVNDFDMRDEQIGATEQYGRRSDDLGIDVRTEIGTTPTELARILESDADLVHYVGHHDTGDGLRCYGGHLSAAEVGATDLRTFFLNACGSYHFGRALIEKGAEGGVATTTAVMDEAAAGLGLTWSRLMTYGWPVVSALEYARRVADEPLLDYVTVGEGTTVLTQSDSHLSPTVEIERDDSTNGWQIEMVCEHPIYHGIQITSPLDEEWWVSGDGTSNEVNTEQLGSFLRSLDRPVVIGDQFRWPGEYSFLEE